MSSVQEQWKPAVGFEGVYEVSDRGQVRRVSRRSGANNLGQPMRLRHMNAGYLMVSLSVGCKKHKRLVHRLVAEAFLGPAPEGYFVNHIDGDKMNNQCSNLEYLTPKDSTAHALSIGAMPYGERHKNAKLTYEAVAFIRRARGSARAADLANRFGVTVGTIRRVWRGESWSRGL